MGDLYGASRRRLIGEAWFWILIVLISVMILTAVGWGIRYATQGPRGAIGARGQQQDANTRVQKQEQFEQLAADFDGYLIKIGIAQDALAAANKAGNEIDAELRSTELIGLKQTCVDAAQQFNAESRKYTARVWKSAGLPPTLDAALCR